MRDHPNLWSQRDVGVKGAHGGTGLRWRRLDVQTTIWGALCLLKCVCGVTGVCVCTGEKAEVCSAKYMAVLV